MCQLFINADVKNWENKTRSLRIDGVITSIRLEQFFWNVLEEIAACDEMTVNQLITRLYHESLDADHDIGNFTSFLRVCCGRFLSLAADGELKRNEKLSLGSLNVEEIFQREKSAQLHRKTRVAAVNSNKH